MSDLIYCTKCRVPVRTAANGETHMYCGHRIEDSDRSIFSEWAPEERTEELYEKWNSAHPDRHICHEIECHGGSPYILPGDEPEPE